MSGRELDDRLVAIARENPGVLIGDTSHGELDAVVDRGPARWLIAVAAAGIGAALGMLVSLLLIPDQPDQVLVPVPERVPSMHVDPDDGVRA